MTAIDYAKTSEDSEIAELVFTVMDEELLDEKINDIEL
jgi:hypothetical protein